MSWTEDAQKSKSGTSDKKAGDPAQSCPEHAMVEAVLDIDEPVELQPRLEVPVPPAIESKVATEPKPAAIESKVATEGKPASVVPVVYVAPPEEEGD
jgi:hypothetical protein